MVISLATSQAQISRLGIWGDKEVLDKRGRLHSLLEGAAAV